MKTCVLAFIFIFPFVYSKCPYGLIESAACLGDHLNQFYHSTMFILGHLDCDICVEAYTLLIGGRNLYDWRTDAEVWDNKGRMDMAISSFPFRLGNIFQK